MFNSMSKDKQIQIEKAFDSGKHVYFVKSIGKDMVKIGIAQDPKHRIKDLQVGSPLELKLIFVIPYGGYVLEESLHRYFKINHIRGEWYKYDKLVIEMIKDIKKVLREDKWIRQANQLQRA